jgi:ribosomal protein S18 acetylase RimI-like enzyme
MVHERTPCPWEAAGRPCPPRYAAQPSAVNPTGVRQTTLTLVTDALGVEHGAFWALDLPVPGQAPIARVATRFGAVDELAIPTLAAAMAVPEAVVAERLARGSRALALWHGEEVASYCWVSAGREHVGELGRDILLPPGESYVWDCATIERFRGHGLYTSLLRTIADMLAAEGQHRVWTGATTTNEASNRAFTAVGYRPAASVISIRIAGRGFVVRLRGSDRAMVEAARRLLTG